ncbi:MAG TPA: alpha/beta hydrolase [Chloroflexota bacterium]|nr:alpha/beta hydrolase [Chloroflexota bacterium]
MANGALGYDPARRYDVKVEDVEYRRDGDRSWLALTYQPQGEGPFPALLAIHGGAWNNGDRTGAPALGEGLAASGVLVVSINFRMGGTDPYPSSLADINYATRWLKHHAADFHADPATVGGLGISSGGHLIMLSAMRPRDPRYAALPLPQAAGRDATLAYVISLWGVLDPLGRYRMAEARGLTHYLEYHDAYFGTVETQAEASPLLILQRGEPVELPPALLIQGTADEGVPQGMVEQVASLYQAAGGQAELAWFEGMPHGIAGWPDADVARMIERIKAFIARQVAPPVAAR